MTSKGNIPIENIIINKDATNWASRLHCWSRSKFSGKRPKWLTKKLVSLTARLFLMANPAVVSIQPVTIGADQITEKCLDQFCTRKNPTIINGRNLINGFSGLHGGTFVLKHKKRGYVVVAHAKSAAELNTRFGSAFDVIGPPKDVTEDPNMCRAWASSLASGDSEKLRNELILGKPVTVPPLYVDSSSYPASIRIAKDKAYGACGVKNAEMP